MIWKSLFIVLLLPISMQEISILLLVPIVFTHTVPFILILIRIALVVLPLQRTKEKVFFCNIRLLFLITYSQRISLDKLTKPPVQAIRNHVQ